MRTTSHLLILGLIVSLHGCSRKDSSKPPTEIAPQPTYQQAEDDETPQPVIKAATPEDPGPIATVVSPLATWTKNAKHSHVQLRPVEPQTREQAAGLRRSSELDHVDLSELPAPQNFLRKRFAVTEYKEFAFTIPPHAASPTLQGSYRAFAKSAKSTSREPAAVELMLMNEEEYSAFVHQRSVAVTYATDPSPGQTVAFPLKSTLGQAQQYHLVFNNSEGSKTKFVDADFTVSFE